MLNKRGKSLLCFYLFNKRWTGKETVTKWWIEDSFHDVKMDYTMKKIFLDKLVPNEFPFMIVNKIMSSVKHLYLSVTSRKVIYRRNYINLIGRQSSIHQLQTAILEEGLYGSFLITKDSEEFPALFCLQTLSASAIFLSL